MLPRIPAPLRRLGRSVLSRRGRGFERTLEESRAEIPKSVVQSIWDDISQLEVCLGLDRPLWKRE